MNPSRFSRRTLLQGIGGAAALLPVLTPRTSQAAGGPKRIIIVQTTNGVIHDAFWPKNTDVNAWDLDSPILKPLLPHKKDLILMGGIELKAALAETVELSGGIGHKSLPHLLTGATGAASRLRDGRTSPCGNAISINQHIANVVAKKSPTPFKSLELGIMTSLAGSRGDNDGLISFNGPAIGSNPARPNGNRPEESPYKFYERIFSAAGQPGRPSGIDPMALVRAQQERKSAIDFVNQELRRLQTNLGTEDKQKVEAHLESVRRLEQELGTPGNAARGDCKSSEPAKIDLTKASSFPAVTKAQFDLLVSAMACDLTRVATVMMSNGSNEDLAMTWLGSGFDGPPAAVGSYKVRDHHNLTHCGCFRAQKITAEAWFMSQFAYLIDALKKVPEGNGTMLDNTVVFWANNMDDGAVHGVRGMPWLLAGSCGGYFKTGRYLRYGDWGQKSHYKGSSMVPHNGVLVSLANAMDVPTENFGKYATGELPMLKA